MWSLGFIRSFAAFGGLQIALTLAVAAGSALGEDLPLPVHTQPPTLPAVSAANAATEMFPVPQSNAPAIAMPAAEFTVDLPATPLDAVHAALVQPGTIAFNAAPLGEALFLLSQQWRVNIVTGGEVNGSVSGIYRNAALKDILEAILTANGYGYRIAGGSLLVMRLQTIGAANPNFNVETIDLPANVDSQQLGEITEALSMLSTPDIGRVQKLPSSNQLLIYDSPDQIAKMLQVVGKIVSGPPAASTPSGGSSLSPVRAATTGAAGQFLCIRPEFISSYEALPALEMALAGIGTVSARAERDEPEASQVIYVFGSSDAIETARQVMAQLDLPQPQVRITAYIYDVAVKDLDRIGVDWSSQTMSQALDVNGIPRNNIRMDGGLLTRAPTVGPVQAATSGATAAAGGAAATAANGGQWFFRTMSSNWELSTVVQALNQSDGARLIADPHITVVNREIATIQIGQEIPYQQIIQNAIGGSNTGTAFREIGVTLQVQPRIAYDGTIELTVTPEVSSLAGYDPNGQPIIDTRNANTTVRVGNRQTFVLGGLRQKTTVETVKGIPGLMNVKFIGPLFRSNRTEVRDSELICFIQPEVVDSCFNALPREQMAIETSKELLSRIQVASPSPVMCECGNKHCPEHHPWQRTNGGLPDNGLVGPVEDYPLTSTPEQVFVPAVQPPYTLSQP